MNDGFLNVVKPPALTSHDVVQKVRKLARTKVGHTGTLDPAAAGVLVLSVGAATRLSQYLLDLQKSYRAEFTLGITTDTHDAEGTVACSRPVRGLAVRSVRDTLAALTGEVEMIPPAYSAAHVGGRRAYELAREGKALGEELGCGAYLSALVRTAVGHHRIEDAATLPELESDGIEAHLIRPADALAHLPAVTLDDRRIAVVRHGNGISDGVERQPGAMVRLLAPSGALMALAEYIRDDHGSYLQPRTVLPA